MTYTNNELRSLSYAELCQVKPDDMIEYPPALGHGYQAIVQYSCRYCDKPLEGSERLANANAKDVRCPYCKELLWDSKGRNRLRRSAFSLGHFETERKKCYLRVLKGRARRKES